jgi:predicted AlkP superfamily pyrophosphatase or phosphodiesterase
MYPADGRKVFDIYAWPYSIRTDIKRRLGEFPFPGFWGPAAGVDTPQGSSDAASRWIAASAKWIEDVFKPTLSLVYLPHLDYNLQRHGPYVPPGAGSDRARSDETSRSINPAIHRDLREIDAIVGDLISFFQQQSIRVLLLSEYGITNVKLPIHLNRLFRQMGWLTVKEELGLELLDCGASRVFAVADHQVAHIYFNDRSILKEVRTLLESTEGISHVLFGEAKAAAGIDHSRAGDLIAVAAENAWFTYYYWMDDTVAPDFARCVDIHRKPGYDPVELFLDPQILGVKLRILGKLLKKKLGFRMLMNVIPLDATLVKGSHGCRPSNVADYPILISDQPSIRGGSQIEAQDVYQVIRRLVME